MGRVTSVRDVTLDGPHGPLGVRVYAPEAPTGPGLVWLHGGSFAGGDLDMPEADWVARRFATHGVTVVSVDYRRAPLSGLGLPSSDPAQPDEGVHYPVASEEAAFAFEWSAGSDLAAGPWVLGGASAGGNLASGATLRLMSDGGVLPALVVLAYPSLHAVQPTPDAALRAALDADPDADRFGPEPLLRIYENYLGGPVTDAEIFAVPGLATAAELADFPPTVIVNSDVDELRVSGETFAATLRDAGAHVDVSTEPGTRHGHLNLPDDPAAMASVDRFAARILTRAGATRAMTE